MNDPVPFRKTESLGHAATAGVLSKPRLELRIGSNIFRSTNGVVTIHGKEQLVVEVRPEQRLLLATLDLYNEHGVRIAHVRRNVLTVNEQGRFTVDAPPAHSLSSQDGPSLRVIDVRSSHVVFEARMVSEQRVDLARGTLYSHKGILVEVTPHYCRVGSGTAFFGNIAEARGGPAILG
ncbi:MAG: hypothetical protein A4E19_05905 [Nitrospira sp. SG-bin1]|nr:MAG: hypothetical protein A4E19_05905 [Nitrospira sp. SG-bin1]